MERHQTPAPERLVITCSLFICLLIFLFIPLHPHCPVSQQQRLKARHTTAYAHQSHSFPTFSFYFSFYLLLLPRPLEQQITDTTPTLYGIRTLPIFLILALPFLLSTLYSFLTPEISFTYKLDLDAHVYKNSLSLTEREDHNRGSHTPVLTLCVLCVFCLGDRLVNQLFTRSRPIPFPLSLSLHPACFSVSAIVRWTSCSHDLAELFSFPSHILSDLLQDDFSHSQHLTYIHLGAHQ